MVIQKAHTFIQIQHCGCCNLKMLVWAFNLNIPCRYIMWILPLVTSTSLLCTHLGGVIMGKIAGVEDS